MLDAGNTPSPKALGAFYTPATIAEMLATWVVRTGSERILEPSVGEGALVDAAMQRAASLGANRLRFLTCDISPASAESVLPRLPARSEARTIDFLQLDAASTGLFSAVLANPPFTRNHSISETRRAALREKFSISGAAGLWVHFLLHSLDFLAPGGRLAAVIPASGTFSNYGQSALARVAGAFRHVEIRQFVDRPLWVNGAEERGAVILAEGFHEGSSAVPTATTWTSRGEHKTTFSVDNTAFDSVLALAVPLGSIATLSIGAVTGYNKVFLLSEAERRQMKIPKADVCQVVSRGRQVPGVQISSDDLVLGALDGERTWLLSPRRLGPRGSPVRKQLAKISAERRRSTLWFTKRDPWWKVDITKPCDAVFTYMNDFGPRLVLTKDDVRCTNTLHGVWFRANVLRRHRLAAALSFVSTFGQLAAERLGRSYGGGLLKFELREARSMPVLLPLSANLKHAFDRIDRLLRDGDRGGARDVADATLLPLILGNTWRASVKEMRSELDLRRATRQGKSR